MQSKKRIHPKTKTRVYLFLTLNKLKLILPKSEVTRGHLRIVSMFVCMCTHMHSSSFNSLN